jgi:hypothetical protein
MKQSDFTVCTICDSNWIPTFLRRFLKLAHRAMPDARYCLALYTPQAQPVVDDTGVYAEVSAMLDKIEILPLPEAQAERRESGGRDAKGRFKPATVIPAQDRADAARQEYNTRRMGLGDLFGVDEYLYVDADVEILADISDIPDKTDKALAWCPSPVMNHDWPPIAKTFGYDMDYVANNGLLYVRGDLREQYSAVYHRLKTEMLTPARTRGMMAMNVLLRERPELSHMLEYIYGVIWWDTERMAKNQHGQEAPIMALAKTVHYCNDKGKAKMAERDGLWIW